MFKIASTQLFLIFQNISNILTQLSLPLQEEQEYRNFYYLKVLLHFTQLNNLIKKIKTNAVRINYNIIE